MRRNGRRQSFMIVVKGMWSYLETTVRWTCEVLHSDYPMDKEPRSGRWQQAGLSSGRLPQIAGMQAALRTILTSRKHLCHGID
jgi:hypothetical protein